MEKQKKVIVLYHPDFLVDPEIKKLAEKRGERVRYANADFFNLRDLEPAKLVVLAPKIEQADAITEAYEAVGVKVVALDDFLKGKAEVPADPKVPAFDPDAALPAKGKKAAK